MKLSYLYNQIVKFGIDRDPRKKNEIRSFEDTAILYGNPDREIKRIMIGIDIEVGELLLADKIRQEKGLDLVMAHHPEGKAYAALSEVMKLQIELLRKAGIPKPIANQLLDERMQEVARKILPQNHMRAVDTAQLLDMPFMCVHTPADNHVSCYIQELIRQEKPERVQDILDILLDIPEYKEAGKYFAGPRVILGNPKRKTGKIFVEMTGGTEGSKDTFDKFYKVGIRSIVAMHLSEEHFKKVKDANLNVVIAGHISSDTLGLNLLLDRIEQQARERLEIINCSGFRRVRRQ
jgi:putative NIF3 family GTP cyclohydrolase 1 type 2